METETRQYQIVFGSAYIIELNFRDAETGGAW
jgi:hypothetical protein